jgi:hypothetical protein
MPKLIELPHRADSRGVLTIAEEVLPFTPARVFWITGADGQTRGGHRHVRTEMVLVALQGEVTINVQTPSEHRSIPLASPTVGLHLFPEDWHTMTFGPSSILLVIASHGYDPIDYITEPYEQSR